MKNKFCGVPFECTITYKNDINSLMDGELVCKTVVCHIKINNSA